MSKRSGAVVGVPRFLEGDNGGADALVELGKKGQKNGVESNAI